MAVAANRFQLARTLDEERAQLRAPLQSDVIYKQQHQCFADGVRVAQPGQTLRFNLPTDPGKFLDTIQSYFSFDVAIQESQGLPVAAGGSGAGLVAANAVTATLGPVVGSSAAAITSASQTEDSAASTCTNPIVEATLYQTTTGSALPPYYATNSHCVVPVGGVTSLIKMVRLLSRGAIIEEIDEYGLLDQFLTELTQPYDEQVGDGWLAGNQPHGYDYQSKIAAHCKRWAPTQGSTTGDNATYRRFCFRLDRLGFFASQHYIPLEWLPVTIEIVFQSPDKCLRGHWYNSSGTVTRQFTPSATSFYVYNPIFHMQLLQFNSEYTSAVNNKIASDGAVLPIKTWRHTSRYYTGPSDKMILTNKMKSLTRIFCVPRQASVVNSGGLGMDTYCSLIPGYGTTNPNAALNGPQITNSAETTQVELWNYRWLIGSTPVTDHAIDCMYGGAMQFMELVKTVRSMGHEVTFGKCGRNSAYGNNGWVDNFKQEFGLIAQNFNLEMIESDDIFTGMFANTFSDITLELNFTQTGFQDADKLLLDFYFQYNALLTITPTALLIES